MSRHNQELFIKKIGFAPDEKIPLEKYVSSLPFIKHLKKEAIAFTKPVTFIIGENGTERVF